MNPNILVSPSGQKWAVSVDDNGLLSAKALPNPPVLVADSTGGIWQVGVNPDGTLFTKKTTVVTQP